MSATTGGAGAPRAKGGNTVGRRKKRARGAGCFKKLPPRRRGSFFRATFSLRSARKIDKKFDTPKANMLNFSRGEKWQ